jgi:membrane protein DedA with SNARE-associated domain
MTDTIHLLIEKYGLFAVFLGSLAEGESAAILAGFFAHQHVFVAWQAYAAAFLGAFLGDTTFFTVGRYFSERPFVLRLRQKPGFSHAYELVQSHPNLFVLSNRYVYGFRLVGGVAAGLSRISPVRFVVLNALSALVWAALFCGIGYVFGLGAEQIIGQKLMKHERLLIALGGGVTIGLATFFAARYFSRKAGRSESD